MAMSCPRSCEKPLPFTTYSSTNQDEILYTVVLILQLAIICLYASKHDLNSASKFTLPVSLVALVTIAALAVLSLLDHSRSPNPCFVVQFFLFITLLLDSARLRSIWLTSDGDVIAALYTTAFVSKALVLLVESLHKTTHFVDQSPGPVSPEETAGLFSRTMLFWLNPLFLRGYRKKLSVEDLYCIDDDLASHKVTEALDDAWLHVRTTRRRRLAFSLARAFPGSLMLVHVPRLALVGFALTQPLLIEAALAYVEDHASRPVKYGQALIGAFALNYISVAVWL